MCCDTELCNTLLSPGSSGTGDTGDTGETISLAIGKLHTVLT